MAYGEHTYRVSVEWTGNRGSGTSGYRDDAEGTMLADPRQARFSTLVLRPRVVARTADQAALAGQEHHVAHEKCYIANPVNFPILCEPLIAVGKYEVGEE